ncbi:hypothetical protein [Candidatus Rhabdochlamydia porcellionis]|jgi:hypothetical protein|uniref:Uncharacterized protein n=1 Tax=Candidatus Rhabdochlamydia porcellionis TaxID=225148 RepID=A0ABX8YY65_9BACT|nr:hypothetical protein [Candidatus Rhabdochlamydia porcellionis]QZA58225.1 hypothetical protein RHAB15C_0000095 [Candidatus Rhabdochlamydia porcellionis]
MTWPSDLARRSTNPFSPQNMITKNLMDQALKNERSRTDNLIRNDPDRSSGSSNGSTEPHSQRYIDFKKELFFNSSTSSKSPEIPNLSERVKNCFIL